MDALSAFFLFLLGAVVAGVSVFAAGYMRAGEGTAPGLQCLWYHLFLASMAFVLVADDAYGFMVAWESMAVSSFFLVTSDHRQAEIRRAGYLYLLIAHVGAIAILLCFGVLQGGTHDYTFGAMRAVQLAPFWATVGVPARALRLRRRRPASCRCTPGCPRRTRPRPRPVSALMSAVMLKTAIYGMLRVTFDLLHTQVWWWGVIALAIGLATAIFGVVFSAVQSDMKRLLAYSSIENIGFIVVGFGLTVTFAAYGMGSLAALALTATLYHCLNHAYFKSLLFLATGSVLHATRERALGRLGGLIHRMPWVAWLALVGALAHRRAAAAQRLRLGMAAAAGVPLHAGAARQLSQHAGPARRGGDRARRRALRLRDGEVLRHRVPRPAARGAARRGARRRHLAADRAHLARRRLRRVSASSRCRSCGLIDFVTGPLDRQRRSPRRPRAAHWIFLAPIDPQRASYSPLLFVIGLAVVTLAAWLAVRRFYHGRVRRAPPWDCGFPLLNARMQDTAEGFGQPVRVVFEPFFRVGARAARPCRRRAALPGRGRGPALVLGVPAGRAHRRAHHTLRRPCSSAAASRSTSCTASPRCWCCCSSCGEARMSFSWSGAIAQLTELVLAILLAPLLLGWVNQCRAWLQNKSGPGVLRPYLVLRQALRQGRDRRARRIARSFAPCRTCSSARCAWRRRSCRRSAPTSPTRRRRTRSRWSASSRSRGSRIALAAMDIGTAFGSLGARREMMVGFLAEPALLMVLFTASLISQTTSLATTVETLSHRELAIYPSLAFAGVAFTMVSLAENARIPVDNPATHLELTMIHEAMILEYSGRHLALVEWAASLKLFVYSCIGIALFFPFGIARGRRCYRAPARAAGARPQARHRRIPAGADRDAVGEDAHLPRPGVPRHRVHARGARAAAAHSSGELVTALPTPALIGQIINVFAAVLLLVSFAMLAQRRILSLIDLFAAQGLVLCLSTAFVAWATGQTHLYWSAGLTLVAQGAPAAVDPAPAHPPART